MNKQELIDKLNKQLTTPSVIKGSDFDCGHNYGIELAIIFARQLEEPEKPVVPQFVADLYESIKDDFEYKVYELCLQYKHRGDELPQGVAWWFGDSRNKPIETLVMMHKFGYEVEKEKVYTVELPNPNTPGYFVLRKNDEDKVVIDIYHIEWWRDYKCTWLTEAQIKKDFAWAWKVAEEVEEC